MLLRRALQSIASLSAVISARTSLDPQGAGLRERGINKAGRRRVLTRRRNLEKTIIRSPISIVEQFHHQARDFLAPAQQVAVVSNNGALEAVAYVTEEDKARVAVGQKIKLEGDYGDNHEDRACA